MAALQRFAVLADIHGNSAALSAVLADMAARGLSEAVNLGDHFSGPLDAGGTAKILLQHNFPSIRGNHDRLLVEQPADEMGASDSVAHAQLSTDHLRWIRDQPATLRVADDVFLCHDTPNSDTTYWLEQVRADGFVGMADRPWIEAQAEGIDATLILCGHTHTQRAVRLADGRLVVNPGSVGCPVYDNDLPVFHIVQAASPAAAYAILERTAAGWDVTFRQVPYDATAMVALATRNGRDGWARALDSGWVEG